MKPFLTVTKSKLKQLPHRSKETQANHKMFFFCCHELKWIVKSKSLWSTMLLKSSQSHGEIQTCIVVWTLTDTKAWTQSSGLESPGWKTTEECLQHFQHHKPLLFFPPPSTYRFFGNVSPMTGLFSSNGKKGRNFCNLVLAYFLLVLQGVIGNSFNLVELGEWWAMSEFALGAT